ncbi:MAG: DegT/DnrJ/EryC1/StrS aminotransferase family protein [Bacteroidales bacterium]|nr:DegT/DnrJ/EryC1/StrS aminotransferase family protein [Bacteroidales bacterium]
MKYPVYIPDLTEKESDNVNDCLKSTWISSRGKYIDEFEKSMCNFTGCKNALAVSNGTVALHLALLALDIKRGDEVIVPDFTYIATANAVLYVGATPVFADVDPYSWNITAQTIRKLITPKTKAIIVVDVYGCPVDIDSIIDIAVENNIFIIEDAAESLGATYKNRKAGNLGHISTLSFFGNKTITTGEGGMVLTNNKKLADKIAQLKNQGNSNSIRYFHDVLGYNYRMTNIQAAIGCAQMERIDKIIQRKTDIFNFYKKRLLNKVVFQSIDSNTSSSYWMIAFKVKDKATKDGLMKHLELCGIETRPFFFPVSDMPFYSKTNTPISKELSETGVIVPSYPSLSDEDLIFITEKIIDYLSNK